MNRTTYWCEQCGEQEQGLSFEMAGTCLDCAAGTIREVIADSLGSVAGRALICGQPLFKKGVLVSFCALPYGEEHDHN